MARENRGLLIAFGVIGAVFALALVHLFALRLEAGDVYPPYSSYRADPLGLRALYGALEALSDVTVDRNLKPIKYFQAGPGDTLLFCGAFPTDDPEDVIEALEGCVHSGARLVIAFHPFADDPEEILNGFGGCAGGRCRLPPERGDEEDEKDEEAGGEDGDEDEAEDEEGDEKAPWEAEPVSIADRWGFEYAYAPLPEKTDEEFGRAVAQKQDAADEFPETLPWHSAMYFDGLDEAWETRYGWDGHAVLVERPWGLGAIVLASDSYLMSNEAMLTGRRPHLLSWLIGDSGHVVFDETHLGTQESPGIMTLVRRYGLHGVVAAIVLTALLFVWKNAVSLVPKRDEAAAAAAFAGPAKDSTAALTNLLRRSIPAPDLLSVCVDEWRRAYCRSAKRTKAEEDRIEAILIRERGAPQPDYAAAYRGICEVLKKARRGGIE